MKQQNKLVISNSTNPYFNLALEEYLFYNLKKNETIFYLWQNQNTIVIGNNQNPWIECDIEKTKKDKIKIARRLSGGGSVFHDLGNLNFTFITNEKNYNLEKQLSIIIDALKLFNINAAFTGRNDITVNDKKFSGNAFYFDEEKAYHHGTILIDVDILKLSNYLTPSKQKIISKGIKSIKSRVINLHTLNNLLTVDTMKTSLVKSFQKIYGNFNSTLEFNENTKNDTIKSLYNKYSSWSWVYGESPIFDAEYKHKFSWGEIQIGLNIDKGKIKNCKVFTDSLNTKFVNKLSTALQDISFKNIEIKNAIKNIPKQNSEELLFKDIERLFN